MQISVAQGQSVGTGAAMLSELVKQGVFLILSVFLIWLMDKSFGWDKYGFLEWPILMIYIGLMFFTAFMGTENMGSRAWIMVGSFSFQPSELGKVLIILSVAYAVYDAKRHGRAREGFWEMFKVPLIFSFANAAALFLQKDFGSMTIFLGIGLICMLVPNFPGLRRTQHRLKMAVLALAVTGTLAMAFSSQLTTYMASVPGISHIAVRIENMKDPYRDIYNDGYQPANSLYGIGDAGVMGKGLGNSARKYGYLTQAESDYIFAITIEETGLIGLVLICFFYGVIVWRLFYYAFRTNRISDKVILCGTAAYLLLHFIINIGGVGGLIPMTGVPLLFISGGGSALISLSLMIGIALNCIARINTRSRRMRRAV